MVKYLFPVFLSALMWPASLSAAGALPSGATLREDGYTLAPFSFVRFCTDYPRECPASGGPSRVALNTSRMAQLSAVNSAVNAEIVATPDTSRLRYWRLNVAAGDCNSFAVQKRHDLLLRGWPAAALALTVAKTASGEGHLVVTVRTDQGDLVLDNLRPGIVSWRQTGYRFIMRQSATNPRFWVELHGGHADQTFAARAVDPTELAQQEGRFGAGDPGTAMRLAAPAGDPEYPRFAVEADAGSSGGASGELALGEPFATGPAAPQESLRNPGGAGGFVADIASWMNRNLAPARLAPVVRGAMIGLAAILDARIPAEAARSQTPDSGFARGFDAADDRLI
jgi:predicted transglutaminase-like cysteine proteinase